MSTPPSSAPANAANDVTPEPSPVQWAEIVQQLGAEIAGLVCAADLAPLDRAHALADLGELFLEALPSSDDAGGHVADLEVHASERERQLGPG